MTSAFIIVVSMAITCKLIFLSFSLYHTVKFSKTQDKVAATQNKNTKSLLVSWKQLQQVFLPRSVYCPDAENKNSTNRL